MSQRKSILQNEQPAPGSPLRRSSRIANSPAPPPVAPAPVAPVTRRRSSATAVEAAAPAKLLKSKRLSLSQDNPVEAPQTPKKGAKVTQGATKSPTSQNEKVSTPAKRGRRSSIAKAEEENPRIASPAIGPLTTRRRSVRGQSTSPSKDKPEPAKTRGRRTSITEKVGNLESIVENDASIKKAAPKTRRSLATRRTSMDVPEEMEDIKSVTEPAEKMEGIEELKKPDLNPIIEIAEENEETVLDKSTGSLSSEDKLTLQLAFAEARDIKFLSPISPDKDSTVNCSPIKFTDSPPNLVNTPAINKCIQGSSQKSEGNATLKDQVVSDDTPEDAAEKKVNIDKSNKKTNEDDVEPMDISLDDKSINEDDDVVQDSSKSNEEKRFEDMQVFSTKSKDSSELQDGEDSPEKSKDVPTSTDVKIVDESKDKSDIEFVNESPDNSKKLSSIDSQALEESPTSETDLEVFNVLKCSPIKYNPKKESLDSQTAKKTSQTKIDNVDDQKASTSKDESEVMDVTKISKQNIEVAETAIVSPKEVMLIKEGVTNTPIKTADTLEPLDTAIETKPDSNTSLTTNQNTPNKTPKKVLSMKQMDDNSINAEKPITPSKSSPNVSASKKENGDESLNVKKTPKSDVKKNEEKEQIKSSEKSKLSKSLSDEGNSLNSNKKTPKKRTDDCLIVNEFQMVSGSDGSFHLNFSLPVSDASTEKKEVLNTSSGSNSSDKENMQSPEKITLKTPSKAFSELKDVKNQSTPKSKLSELTKPVDDGIEMSQGNKTTDLIVNNVAKETDPEQDLIKVLNEFEPEALKYENNLTQKQPDVAEKENLSETAVKDKSEEGLIASPKEKEIDQIPAETSEQNETVEMEVDVPALSTSDNQQIDKNVSSPNVGDNIETSKEENANLENNKQKSDSTSIENLSNNIEENDKSIEKNAPSELHSTSSEKLSNTIEESNKSKEKCATEESEENELSSPSSKTSSEDSKGSDSTDKSKGRSTGDELEHNSSSSSSKTSSEDSKESDSTDKSKEKSTGDELGEHNSSSSSSKTSSEESKGSDTMDKPKEKNATDESEEHNSSSSSSKTTSGESKDSDTKDKPKEKCATSESEDHESSSTSSKTSSDDGKKTDTMNKPNEKILNDVSEEQESSSCSSKSTIEEELNSSQANIVEEQEQEITDDDINVSNSLEKSSTSLMIDSEKEVTTDLETTVNVDDVVESERRTSLLKIDDDEKSAVNKSEETDASPEADTVNSSEHSDDVEKIENSDELEKPEHSAEVKMPENSDMEIHENSNEVEMPENVINVEAENEPKITSSTADTVGCSDNDSEIMPVKSKKRSLKKQDNVERSMVESTEHINVSKHSKKSDENDLSDDSLESSFLYKSHSSSKRKSNKRKSKSKSKKEEAVFSAEEEEIVSVKQVKKKKEKKKSIKKKNTKVISDSDNECIEYDQITSDVDSNEDDENICNLQVVNDSDDDDNYSNNDNFLDDMAIEAEEDTPSDDSNAIPEYGESLHSSESDKNDSEDDYENDSFIDDNASVELLSGNEYDLSDVDKKDKKKSKKKRSRILSISDSDEDVAANTVSTEVVVEVQEIKNVRKSKSPTKAKQNQIEVLSNITVRKGDESELSEENVDVEEGNEENVDVEEENEENVDVEEENEENVDVEEESEENVDVEEENEIVVSDESNESERICDKPRRKSKKRTSVTLQENLKVADLAQGTINEKIAQAVVYFCSSIKEPTGNVSLNVSLDYDNLSDEDSNPSPPKRKKIRAKKPKTVENKAETSFRESKSQKKKLQRKSSTEVESETPVAENTEKLQTKSRSKNSKRRSESEILNDIDKEPIDATVEAPPKKKKRVKQDSSESDNIPTQHIEYLPKSLITELSQNPTVSLREKSPKDKTLKKKKVKIAPTTKIGSDEWDIKSMTKIKPSKSSIKTVDRQLQQQQNELPVNDFRNRTIILSSQREDFRKVLKTKKK